MSPRPISDFRTSEFRINGDVGAFSSRECADDALWRIVVGIASCCARVMAMETLLELDSSLSDCISTEFGDRSRGDVISSRVGSSISGFVKSGVEIGDCFSFPGNRTCNYNGE